MKHKNLHLKKTAIALALVGMLGAQTTVHSRTVVPGPAISMTSSSIVVNASGDGTLIKVVIRVALPNGVEERVSNDGSVEFDASGLPDGKYQYEAWALMSNADGKYTTDNSRGSIIVQGGSIVPKPMARGAGEEESALDSILDDTKDLLVSASSAVLDFVIPMAKAGPDLSIDTFTPILDFNDTTTEGSDNDTREWRIEGKDESFTIFDDSNDLDSAANYTPVIKIEALGAYSGHPKITTARTKNSIVIKDTGDISLADDSMYLAKASGKMGLGTITPQQGVHAKYSGKNGYIRMENTAQSTWDFGQYDNSFSNSASDGDFRISIDANGNGGTTGTKLVIKDENGFVGMGTNSPTSPLHISHVKPEIDLHDINTDTHFRINDTGNSNLMNISSQVGSGTKRFPLTIHRLAPTDSLTMTSVGVGIGNFSPSKALHITRDDGKGAIRVEENAANVLKRFLLQLDNNGPTGARFTNTSTGDVFQFAQTNNGGFVIGNNATVGQDIKIEPDGVITMGPNLTPNLTLSAAGNLTVVGSATATTHISSSSRTVKKDFAKVDTKDVLDKIRGLEVTEWRYIDKEVKGRHIGPMAEDFYSLFELGPDNKHVAATDMASIALIAAKELQKKAEAADVVTAELKAENKVLKDRLASLERLVTNLASSGNSLNKKGDEVALK